MYDRHLQFYTDGFFDKENRASVAAYVIPTLNATRAVGIDRVVSSAGWGDVSFHGSPQIPTPNIDALASTGVVLNNYYVQPTCSPSRGALLSGRYCIHIGFQETPLLPRQLGGLPLDIKIMPEYFKELGYEPHIVGKWHLGYFSFNYTPTYRGFNSFLGMHVGPTDYYTHVLKWDGLQGLDFWDNTDPLKTENGTYSTTLFTTRAKSIIANRDKSKEQVLELD
ncbi:hypothetical protein HPB49_025553 [Dermacentor silvarum]|uniref:Uncharacterized protein n=1 Tax=Dermacentor silvarum TaxID=543639 RepID=A0ACB8D9M0_DERSI|nr:arylsulfatase B [Dermacentor silvarum]KAH7960989.1 hypothetical protein HPB49_025553 [Dermacentor silvarum]